MILPGHVAAAYLAATALGTDRPAGLVASLFPDLVDKPVRWLFRLTPNDRIPAHTLLVCMLTWLATHLLLGQGFSRGWLVGYGAHLLCDQANAHLNPGRLYLWWPFRRYKMHTGPTGLGSSLSDFSPASLVLEGGVVVLGVATWLLRRRRR
ncbi:MAG TPA: metal-dependent hydrolase [Anaerolineae bacterium]|nr:metal-dependent hydrolase [Anaerolineae bacterium]